MVKKAMAAARTSSRVGSLRGSGAIARLLSRPVVTLPASATCADAARQMRRENVGSIVIEERGLPIGIVTDRDLALRVVADELDPAQKHLGSIMSQVPALLSSECDLGSAVRTMRDVNVRRLPVVDRENQLVGILSLDDVLRELCGYFGDIGALVSAVSAGREPDDQVPD